MINQIVVLAFLFLACAPSTHSAEPDASASITIDGMRRDYILHVPPSIGDAPVPLVLVFHGGGQSAKDAVKFTAFDALADREGFIVAYPDGVSHSWNDGRQTTKAAKKEVGDVRFIRELIAKLSSQHKIDPRRVYATGPSNGGFMSHRLGCELSDVLAAIGPEIAGFPSKLRDACRPAQPLSVILIQGTADPLVPIGGGEVGGKHHWGAGGKTDSAASTLTFWAEKEGCQEPPEKSVRPDTAKDDTKVHVSDYRTCRSGVEVAQYIVEGMGHRWPTANSSIKRPRLVTWILGPGSKNIDATETIWQFFKFHPKP